MAGGANDSLKGILQGIYESEGVLTPELVVNKARAPEHPLHHRFEWDDAIAGEKFRTEQARGLIRSVKVVYGQDDQGRDKSVRAFVSRRGPDVPHPVYEPVEEVVMDPLRRQMVLRDMQRDWRVFKSRYEHLAEFAELIASTAETA